ncbi:hypothetical protein DRE_04900 [Drechslerella stenobrocha 248]|uniref:Uncharacterized protein n=1 Tax=Drechslerella stenobrocha 248 TaxID=1043628 RepID=W7I0Y3_9PEZI|nr:hypothetical protein DRE_04900 [Drechslerella stenobrocha 248]
MSFLNKLRHSGANEPTPVINVEPNGNSNPRVSSRSPPSAGRFRSKSPNANGRSRSAIRTQSFPSNPPPFPTPFHPFKLHPLSNKNQVNALKFIDRIDSLLFLGHTGQTILNAIPPCMGNSEAQAWYTRVMGSDIRRPSTIEEFRALLITDHIWSIEQTRINTRYQSTNSNNANRRDPYLDSAEFKLHLSYIRDTVRLEEAQARDEKKIAQLETEKIQLTEREGTLQMAVADLQNDAVARNGGQPVPVLQRTNDILSNMKQLDDSKLKVSMLEQEKRALSEKITALQMKMDDADSTNTQMSTVRLQLQNSNSKNAELQGIILQLEQSNSRLQQQLIAAQDAQPATSQSPPPASTGADARELQRLKKQNQQLLEDAHQKEIRIHDLEAQVRSYSFLQSQKNEVQPAPASVDRAALAGLEDIIKQKDMTISNMHGNLNKLTDEAINRIHRVYQVEQLLLDQQLLVRNKDSQIFALERRIRNLGHSGDCNCATCSLNSPMRISSPDVKRTTSPELKPGPRVMSIGSSSELSGPTISSRTGTPFQQLPIGNIRSPPSSSSSSNPPRFLDIKFKYTEVYPAFLPPSVAPRVAQLLQNGLAILHPSHEFTKLWENIAHGLLETLGGDAHSLGDLTRHMKLCFRENGGFAGDSPNGLVVAPVWSEVWSSVSGLDVVCDF